MFYKILKRKIQTTRTNLSDILPNNILNNVPKFKKNPNHLNIPWLINGAPVLQMKTRFLPEQVFARATISRHELLKHLFKIYRGVLLSSTQYDYGFMEEYVEQTFFEKFKKQLVSFENRGYSVELLEDFQANNGVRLHPEFYLYDCVIIKGLSLDRKKNLTSKDYSVCDDLDDMGFISYIPNNLSDPNNFLTKDKAEQTINSDFKNVIFRAYCMFKSGMKLFIKDDQNIDLIQYNDDYNYNHIAVFETQMIGPEPLKSFSKTETYTEWITKHKFGTWKLIDLDNWMNGNHYFIS